MTNIFIYLLLETFHLCIHYIVLLEQLCDIVLMIMDFICFKYDGVIGRKGCALTLPKCKQNHMHI